MPQSVLDIAMPVAQTQFIECLRLGFLKLKKNNIFIETLTSPTHSGSWRKKQRKKESSKQKFAAGNVFECIFWYFGFWFSYPIKYVKTEDFLAVRKSVEKLENICLQFLACSDKTISSPSGRLDRRANPLKLVRRSTGRLDCA